jgi:hypothetical protein
MSATLFILIHVIGIVAVFALGYHMGARNRR